jgi:hypothetical protein
MTGASPRAKRGGPDRAVDSQHVGKKKLGAMMSGGNPEAGPLVPGAVEVFARELTTIIRRFMRLKEWKDIRRIVIGGDPRKLNRRSKRSPDYIEVVPDYLVGEI